jgi:hypothetical protein
MPLCVPIVEDRGYYEIIGRPRPWHLEYQQGDTVTILATGLQGWGYDYVARVDFGPERIEREYPYTSGVYMVQGDPPPRQ